MPEHGVARLLWEKNYRIEYMNNSDYKGLPATWTEVPPDHKFSHQYIYRWVHED